MINNYKYTNIILASLIQKRSSSFFLFFLKVIYNHVVSFYLYKVYTQINCNCIDCQAQWLNMNIPWNFLKALMTMKINCGWYPRSYYTTGFPLGIYENSSTFIGADENGRLHRWFGDLQIIKKFSRIYKSQIERLSYLSFLYKRTMLTFAVINFVIMLFL